MLRSSDTAAPITPTKRPLTELFTTANRMDGNDVMSKKRKLSGSPVDSRDEKENRQTTDAQMYTTTGESQAPQASLPTPLSTPTNLREQSPALTATTPPKSISTIPHIFAHAHLLLSTSSPLTSSLPLSGRSDQLETLLAFLTRRFPKVYSTDPSGSTVPSPRGPGPAALYASGPPGIGKTALLNSVLGEFVKKIGEKELGEEVRVCMRNCSTVGLGETAWERLGTGLGMDWKSNGGATKLKGRELFEQGLRDGKKYLLILDEIDHLCTTSNGSSSAPDLLNALFSLASIPSSPLTLIGIANDLTLKALNLSSSIPSPTSRLALGKGKAKLDPLTTPTKPINLHFAPYSWQELVKIVHQRLELLSPTYPIPLDQALSSSSPSPSTSPSSVLPKIFPLIDKVALERAAKKVATTTGDVRTILDLVRKSISLSTSALDPDSLSTFTLSTAPKASMKHMTLSLSSSTGLSTAPSLSTRLESLNPNHRFVLVSLTIALSRTLSLGLETVDQALSSQSRITLEEGWKVYREVLGHEESLKSVSHSSKDGFRQAVEMVQDLGGFVTVTNGKGGAATSPNSKRRKTPSPSKKGGNQTLMVISGSESAPINELVKLFSPLSTEGAGSLAEKEDESTRLCRKMISRELSDQRWKRKLVAMGRDEEKRAEEELQGREWERSMKAQANERGELC